MIVPTASRQHPMHEELRELRAESLRYVVVTLSVIAFVQLCANMTISMGNAFSVIFPFSLFLLAIGAWHLLRWTYLGAATLLVVGLISFIAIVAIAYSSRQVLYALPLVVFVAPLLVGNRLALASTTGSAVLAVLLARRGALPLSDDDTLALVLLAGGSLIIAWVAYRPMRTMLSWAWASYLAEIQKTQEVRERQAELLRLSKSLSETCERLEQANVALAQARRAAEQAWRLKDEFAASISHELRTPLNLIIGYSEMISNLASDEDLPVGLREDIETIYRNACHLSDLVDDVLDLGQLDAHRLALQRDWSSLPRVVQEAVDAVRGLYITAGLDLTLDFPADLPLVYIDPTRIRQALINLLTNAVRYTDEGGVRISAYREGQDVVVAVSDTGVGISADDLPFVFERFRQVGQSNRRAGYGLGLAVSKQLVELHGGAMWVVSQPGSGTTFSFSLPTMRNVIALSDEPIRMLLDRSYASGRREHTLLFLVHDADGARVFRRYFDGYRVIVAQTAVEAVRVARTGTVSAVVVTNAESPSSDEMLTSVASHLPYVPVIRCAMKTSSHIGHQLGATAFLTKPVDAEKIRDTLRRLKLRPRRALVVDDDPAMTTLFGRLLRAIEPRCRVQTATSGEHGLASLLSERPDLVLLDLLMPDLDGRAFLRIARSDPSVRDVPIVIVSAASEDERVVVTGECIEIRRIGGLSVADVMSTLRASLDSLLAQPEVLASSRPTEGTSEPVQQHLLIAR